MAILLVNITGFFLCQKKSVVVPTGGLESMRDFFLKIFFGPYEFPFVPYTVNSKS